ncbi:MAG: GtrA family protein [Propionibacteriaceae bacterium]|jgi:putative flippase GtrA|nr:GtrA family protein [Propionibacteriaceae bacterium]
MKTGSLERDFTKQYELSRRQEIIKAVQFTVFAVSAGLIQILVFTVLSEVLKVTYWTSYLIALIASVAWSFTANRRFTFKSVSNIPVAMAKVGAYYAVFAPLSTWWGARLAEQGWGIGVTGQHYIILIGTMVVNLVTEFLVYRFFVYRRSINTSVAGAREQQRVQAQSISGQTPAWSATIK